MSKYGWYLFIFSYWGIALKQESSGRQRRLYYRNIITNQTHIRGVFYLPHDDYLLSISSVVISIDEGTVRGCYGLILKEGE